MGLYYRLSTTDDPEERLEDAALWKAVHDEFGDAVTLLPDDAKTCDGLLIGRGFKNEDRIWRGVKGPYDYWNDLAFIARARRQFTLCDLNEAKAEVDRLHSTGLHAFVKATRQKFYTEKVPIGTTLADQMDAMVFSFCDAGKCLMVQEFATFEFERRYIVMGRQIITSSPIAWHLTPISPEARTRHYRTPRDTEGRADDALTEQMDKFAEECASNLAAPSTCLDIALINGAPGIVELNPLHLGNVGLYACDVHKIAVAIRTLPPTP